MGILDNKDKNMKFYDGYPYILPDENKFRTDQEAEQCKQEAHYYGYNARIESNIKDKCFEVWVSVYPRGTKVPKSQKSSSVIGTEVSE